MVKDEQRLDSWHKHLPEAYAYHQLITNEAGEPVDYLFLQANPVFEAITGLKAGDIIGRRATEVLPSIESGDFDWIGTYGQVAITGEGCQMEQYFHHMERWYCVTAYSDAPGYFALLLHDITQQKKKEEKLEQIIHKQQEAEKYVEKESKRMADLKQVEKSLRESLMRFDELVKNVPVGVYVFWIRDNEHLEFEYVSDRWCEIHQLKREEVLADVMMANNQVHPDEQDDFILQNQKSFRDQIPFIWEGRFYIGDGELRWLRIESTPIIFDNGDIRWFGITEDITERKHAEEILGEKEEQFRAMFEKHHAVMLLIDPDNGKILRVNKSAEKYYGYKAVEIESMTIQQINQLDNEEIATEMANAKGEKRNYFNFIHRLKNGEMRNVEAHSSPIPFKGKTILFSIIHDVTGRKQAEEALTQQSNLLKASQALANLGSWEWDIVRDTWCFSEQWKTIHGVSGNELPTSKLFEIAHPEDTPYIEKAFTDAKEQRKTYDIEHRIIRADNKKVRHIKALGKVEFDQDTGRPVRMVGSAQDVTERKQGEEDLKRAKQQAERANEAKSRYLSHMNHEIRTPLNGFMGFLQLMEETQLDQQQQEYMHHMKQTTSHLQSIINNVLDYAQIETGKIKLENRRFNLEKEIQIALAPLRSLAQQKSIDLEVKMDKNLPHQMEGDPDRLRQIILNLGGNAVKFTQKGQVHITIRCLETTQDHHILQLVVEDNGPGMTQETLEKLFQPFYQADDGSIPQSKGTGLGMAITRELVDRMGGHIHVESKLGEGTWVDVNLKLNKYL